LHAAPDTINVRCRRFVFLLLVTFDSAAAARESISASGSLAMPFCRAVGTLLQAACRLGIIRPVATMLNQQRNGPDAPFVLPKGRWLAQQRIELREGMVV